MQPSFLNALKCQLKFSIYFKELLNIALFILCFLFKQNCDRLVMQDKFETAWGTAGDLVLSETVY